MALTIPENAVVVIPGRAFLVRSFLTSQDCESLGPAIISETFKKWSARRSFGERWDNVKHHMARFGDQGVTYTYKEKPKPMHAFTPTLSLVRKAVKDLIAWEFNCVVLNSYASGSGLYPHRDGKYIPQLGVNPTIASVSFGATRTFNLHPVDPVANKRIKGAVVVGITLAEGDLLVMHGDCDSTYHHSIPEEPNVSGTRVSLTFRKHV